MLRRSVYQVGRSVFQVRLNSFSTANRTVEGDGLGDEFDGVLAEQLNHDNSPTTGVVATVFGSTGFIGRYVVQQLGETGSQIVIPYRGTENVFRHLKVLGDIGQVVPIACDVWKNSQIEETLSQSNVVINLIGKRWGTKNFSLDDVNHKIPARIAAAAKNLGIKRFIHVSSLEASPNSVTEFGYTKYLGEQAVRDIIPEATILRPATVYGHEDRFLNKWGKVMKFWHFTPKIDRSLNKREGPVAAMDLANAVQRCVFDPATIGQTYELEGQIFTLREILQIVKDTTYMAPYELSLPLPAMTFIAKVQELLRYPTITADEWKSTVVDTVAHPSSKTFKDLQIQPADLREEAVKVLRYYRDPQWINEL